MKHIIQNLKDGTTEIIDIPAPQLLPGNLLIRTRASLVSAGTERMLVEFGKANLLTKARQQPDKMREVLNKLKTDGIFTTLDAVRSKLEQPLSLGYANSGVVIAVGDGVEGFSVGDRVASNGLHAEVVCVPKNLCAKVPDGVSNESAAFTVIGAIGLQGIRLARPTLGERFVVTGLGLIGLITAQLLQAHGCKVLGIDPDPNKIEVARQLGVETVDLSKGENPVAAGLNFSGRHGVDGVIITAATRSSEPVHQAAQMCRKRGRIVLVGVTGLELSRADFYGKELSFQVSCSYGPGRYDPAYEQLGQDYPLGYVRWTAQRNFEAVLDMLAYGRLDVAPLISHRFPFDRATEAYDLLASGKPFLGILLEYATPKDLPDEQLQAYSVRLVNVREETGRRIKPQWETPVVGVVGAGNFTTRVMLPALKKTEVRLKTIASSGGVSGTHAGRKFGFEETTTNTGNIFDDPEINAVFVTTRHNSHARFVMECLRASKHVFVEKPLCLTENELNKIVIAHCDKQNLIVMVGFNRRFAPQVQRMKMLLDGVGEPKSFIVTVNAGAIPKDHWTQDPQVGGGRIIGEACHFIDLLRYLVGQPIEDVQVNGMGRVSTMDVVDDKVTINLSFIDGSFGSIHYLANGHKSFPKERVEIFCAGRVLVLDNFRVLRGYGWPGFKRMKLWRQDKGHAKCLSAFIDAVRKGAPAPIPFDEIEEITRVTLKAARLARGQSAEREEFS